MTALADAPSLPIAPLPVAWQVWAMPSGKRHAQPGRALATAIWASWTCYLGFPCMGIWPSGADATDVNACHLSADRSLLLTGGDDGVVKLFHAPCVVEAAPFQPGTGHCSALTCVRFLRGDRAAVSSGGGDRAIILWDLVREAKGVAHPAGTAALPGAPRRELLKNLSPTDPFD